MSPDQISDFPPRKVCGGILLLVTGYVSAGMANVLSTIPALSFIGTLAAYGCAGAGTLCLLAGIGLSINECCSRNHEAPSMQDIEKVPFDAQDKDSSEHHMSQLPNETTPFIPHSFEDLQFIVFTNACTDRLVARYLSLTQVSIVFILHGKQ
jgi:hypothetical protein